jgi:hypothetical protein
MTLTERGDPNRLTWALFDFPAEVHAVFGRFTAGLRPDFPAGHVPDATCPCKPKVFWHSDAAPRPLYEHRR